jgi:hypothetical protein
MSKIFQDFLRSALRTTELIGDLVPHAETAVNPMQITESLQEAYVRLRSQLESRPFGQPIVIRSEDGRESIRGEVHAVIKYPMSELRNALAKPAHLCEVMILHFNIKCCRVSESAHGKILTMYIGKSTPQDLSETTRLDFKITDEALDSENLKTVLTALHGPMGTRNYRITLQAVPLEDGISFLHLTYSYDVNLISRMALDIYLSTAGRAKVGFTLGSKTAKRATVYPPGLRALVERNSMRYFWAVNAYLESANGPEEARLDARLLNWHRATCAYGLQTNEMELKDYISMKHLEVERQQAMSK